MKHIEFAVVWETSEEGGQLQKRWFRDPTSGDPRYDRRATGWARESQLEKCVQ